jgi:hypothetical protein
MSSLTNPSSSESGASSGAQFVDELLPRLDRLSEKSASGLDWLIFSRSRTRSQNPSAMRWPSLGKKSGGNDPKRRDPNLPSSEQLDVLL